MYFHPEPDGPGFWALTKYDDVVTVSQDSATFSSARGGTNIPTMPEAALAHDADADAEHGPAAAHDVPAPRRDGFTPAMIRRMEPHVREITTEHHRQRSRSAASATS